MSYKAWILVAILFGFSAAANLMNLGKMIYESGYEQGEKDAHSVRDRRRDESLRGG